MQTQHGLLVEFDVVPVHNEKKSVDAGRPIFDDTEYIKIMVPGDKYSEVHRAVRPQDKQDFAQEYAAFKAGESTATVGTPLKVWPGVTPAQAKELEYFHVHTVEQLASISDSNAQNIGPIQALRVKAKDFIAAAAGDAPLHKMQAELEKRDAEAAEMRRQLKEATEAIEKLKRNQQHK